jgi:hypothetical protein
VFTEADLYEPLLSGTTAPLGDRRDTIGGAGGMEVIISKTILSAFPEFVVK